MPEAVYQILLIDCAVMPALLERACYKESFRTISSFCFAKANLSNHPDKCALSEIYAKTTLLRLPYNDQPVRMSPIGPFYRTTLLEPF